MYNVCRIDIGKGERVYREIEDKLCVFAKEVRKKYKVHKIIVFGSFIRKNLNEGSDIDIIVVGDFKKRFHKRIADVLGLTDLPEVPTWWYLGSQFLSTTGREQESTPPIISASSFTVSTLSASPIPRPMDIRRSAWVMSISPAPASSKAKNSFPPSEMPSGMVVFTTSP